MCICLPGGSSCFRQVRDDAVFMNRVLIIGVIVIIAASGFGCSRRSANTSESVNANTTTALPDFADANAALSEGTRLFDENQTEQAIAAFQKAVEMNPDLAEAHFKLGVAYALLERQMEQNGMGIPVEVSPDGKRPAKTRSEKAFQKAVEAYQKWLKDNPNDDSAHFYLGRTYSKLLKDEEAEDEFRQAVKLKPDDTEYQTELGAVLIKLAQYREAIGPLKKAIELDGTNDRAIALLEDAEAGRQRVDYVSKNTNVNANTKANANSNSNTNANSGPNSSTNTAPPANTKSTPAPRPSVTPAGPQREVPRSRLANPPTNRPNRPN